MGFFQQWRSGVPPPRCGVSASARPRSRRRIVSVVATLALLLATVRGATVFPQATPDPLIPGFTFPESESTLTRWITQLNRGDVPTAAADAFEKLHRHGWGLWTALTLDSGQTHDGHRLRIFETWLTTDDLAAIPTSSISSISAREWRRAPPRQLTAFETRVADPDPADLQRASTSSIIDRVMGFVKYDPTAADHIVRQQLLRLDALDALLEGGASQIPPFPASALVIKPLFQIVRTKDLVQGRYHPLKAWPGPPPAARPWAPAHWPGSVWLDVLGGGNGRGKVDGLGLFDGSSRTDETTYPLSSLIHHRLSASDAAALNDGEPATNASEGDIAILVAMHVAGREIARWTWQTFWWSPSPDDPLAPSSTTIAGLRPEQLRGAARNYAMALAYTMLSPDQPYVGGQNNAPAVYAYNPWLEAKLGPTDLPDSIPGFAPDGKPAANNHGVQTNCMSCHVQANYNPHRRATAPRFTGARYVDLGAAEFVGTLQVDFLWSIARHAR
jgi:hypothetical protein